MIINFSSGAKDQTQFSVSISVFANWIGGGAGGPSPTVTIQDIFCHPFTQQSDFEQFVSDFNAAIADPSTFSASDQAFLDLYDDGTIGYDDRDAWLHYLLTVAHPVTLVGGRLPWAGRDPLGVMVGLTAISIDPQNAASVKITRGTNNCTEQDGVTPKVPPDLWVGGTGNTYNYVDWYDFNTIDEMNRQSIGISTVRRFPANGGEIYLYARGGDQTLQDGSIGLCRNNSAWTKPTRIVVRNYPGETVTLKCGSKLITSGAGIGQYDHRFEGGGQAQFRCRRSNVTWESILFRGYRDSGAGGRIYCLAAYFVDDTDPSDASAVLNFNFRKMTVQDVFGAQPAYPTSPYLDLGFDRFDEINNVNVDVLTDIPMLTGVVLYSHAQNTKVIQSTFRSAPADTPGVSDYQHGEGLLLSTSAINSLVQRCTLTGLCPHGYVTVGGTGTIVEYNSVANFHATCISFGNANTTIRYNRIDVTTHQNKQTLGIQCAPFNSVASGRIHGNVIWGFQSNGENDNFNIGIGLSRTTAGSTIDNVEVDHNIIYGGGLIQLFGLADTVRNCDIHDNVAVDVPPWNIAEGYDGMVLILLVGDITTGLWGNKIRNNLIYRSDGSTRIVADFNGPPTYYTLAQLNTFPNCSGNISADPMFDDPYGGIFTFLSGASPVYDLITSDPNIPLLPFTEPDLLHGVCAIHVCAEINVGPQYDCKIEVTPKHSAKIKAGPRYTCEISVHECD